MDQHVTAISKVPLREAFPHEAHAFTVWLEQHIDALNDALEVKLVVQQREMGVGDFHADLLCQDEEGNRVIIENQLERSDHSHLGQILTYLVNLEAKAAIWIISEVRYEHQRVVEWMNEITSAEMSFFLVRVEAIRIANSPPAPLFTVVAGPDPRAKEIGKHRQQIEEKEFAQRHLLRRKYWEDLLQRVKGRSELGANRQSTTNHWFSLPTGKSGIQLNYLVLKRGAAIDLYIDTGSFERNKRVFDELKLDEKEIEQECGFQLDWRRLDEKRASRIVRDLPIGGLFQEESWPEMQSRMIDAMDRMQKVFVPRLKRINL